MLHTGNCLLLNKQEINHQGEQVNSFMGNVAKEKSHRSLISNSVLLSCTRHEYCDYVNACHADGQAETGSKREWSKRTELERWNGDCSNVAVYTAAAFKRKIDFYSFLFFQFKIN